MTVVRGRWCKARQPSKFTHFTIDDALITAFLLFVIDGRIVTPYKCSNMRLYIGELRRQPQLNPWRFSPVMHQRIVMRATRRQPRGNERPCGYWHLTRTTSHLLPESERKHLR